MQELSRRTRAVVVQRDAVPPESLVTPARPPQQICADRGHGVRPGQSGIVGHLVERRQAGGEPSRKPIASARLALATGELVSSISRS